MWCRFCRKLDPKETEDRDTAQSRHEYYINNAGMPVMWNVQLKTEISLSSTENEYTGLSYALRETTPIMKLLKLMKDHGLQTNSTKKKLHCRVFEDSSGDLTISCIKKWQPHIKHLNNRLHPFWSYVDKNKEITIHPINKKYQPSDMLTMALNVELLNKFQRIIMGW